MKTVSIVTPWHNQAHFIDDFERAVQFADEVILIDNASDIPTVNALYGLRNRLEAGLITNSTNKSYGEACNQGIAEATGDIIVVMNNDVRAAGDWLSEVRGDVFDNALFGPTVKAVPLCGLQIPYVEGWCIGATRETWKTLGGFDTETYVGNYWEDNDLSFRAAMLGMKLLATTWPIQHINGGNGTSNHTPGAKDNTLRNMQAFERRVREALEVVG